MLAWVSICEMVRSGAMGTSANSSASEGAQQERLVTEMRKRKSPVAFQLLAIAAVWSSVKVLRVKGWSPAEGPTGK